MYRARTQIIMANLGKSSQIPFNQPRNTFCNDKNKLNEVTKICCQHILLWFTYIINAAHYRYWMGFFPNIHSLENYRGFTNVFVHNHFCTTISQRNTQKKALLMKTHAFGTRKYNHSLHLLTYLTSLRENKIKTTQK